MESKQYYLHTSVLKLFFTAAIPGIFSMVASSLYGLFDGIFVGRILGNTSFAALNLAFPFVILNFAVADMIGVGSSAPISISLGEQKDDEANNIFTCSCIMIVVMGFVVGIALYFAAPLMFKLMGAEGKLLEYATEYIRVYALCSPVTTIVFALDNYLKISSKVKLSMWMNISMSAVTVVLEFLFLSVFALGIKGAAMGACFGMIFAVVIGITPFLRGNLQLKFVKPHFRFDMIKRIVKCGLPIFLSNVAGRITSVIMSTSLLKYGGENAMSTHGIMMYVGDLVQPIMYGMCDSLQPAIGYNYGANEKERVKKLTSYCLIGSAIVSVFSIAIINLIPDVLTSLFTSSTDSAFLESTVLALRMYSIGFAFRWFSFATQCYMSAIEKPVYAGAISITNAMVFPVILIFALSSLKLTGLWLNYAGRELFTTVLALILLIRFNKKNVSVESLSDNLSDN